MFGCVLEIQSVCKGMYFFFAFSVYDTYNAFYFLLLTHTLKLYNNYKCVIKILYVKSTIYELLSLLQYSHKLFNVVIDV